MGPKKVLSAEEGDDIKKSLEFMTEEISAVKLQMKAILDLVEEVKALRIQNAEKDRRLAYLENRVADLEQYTRINDVIITGLRIKPRSYARAVAADNVGGPGEEDVNSTELQVVTFLRSKGVEVDYNNIEACHPLPRKNDSDKPAIIVRFANRKHKTALNADIARKARYLKKQGKIQNTWTTNCKVFIKLNGTPEQAKVLVIRNMEELDKY
ncbi:[histone H3]-lysine4 N-trimethyltransferase PRDM7/9 [Sarotherodon galilaeus]